MTLDEIQNFCKEEDFKWDKTTYILTSKPMIKEKAIAFAALYQANCDLFLVLPCGRMKVEVVLRFAEGV